MTPRPALLAFLTSLLFVACNEPSTATRARRSRAVANAVVPGDAGGLVAAGESLYLASAFDSADAVWRRALSQARSESDTLAEARLLTWLGLSARMRGDFAVARRSLEDGLALKLRLKNRAELGESYNALGLLAQDEDRFDDARQAFEQALQSAGDRRLTAKATGNLGLTLAYLGELGEARRLIGAMRDSAVALGERRFEANALANLAMLDIWEGQASDALPLLEQARAIYRTLAFAPGEQNALGQLAVAYEGLGEFGPAFAALDSSLAIAHAKGMREDEEEILRLIAGLHARLGDVPAALREYAQAASLATAVGSLGELGSIHRSTALLHLTLGNFDRARRDAADALRAHRSSGARIDQVDDYLALAEVEQGAGARDAAVRQLGDGRRLAESIGAPSLRRLVALQEARLADAARDPLRVLRALRGVTGDRARLDMVESADADALAARAYARLGKMDSAVAAGGRAIAALAGMRADLSSEALQRSLLADRSTVYADQVLALLRLGHTADAFAVADGARSRGLVEHLSSARGDLVARPSSGELLEGERLLREIDVLLRQLKSFDGLKPSERGAVMDASSARLMAKLEDARGRYESLLVRSATEQPRGAAVLGASPMAPERVRAVLGPKEALLEYLVAPDRIVLFVVTQDSVRVLQLPASLPAITEQTRVLREMWGTRDEAWRLALPSARALYRTLVGPAREAGLLNGVRRLVLVPHGVLSQVPFAALRSDPGDRWLVQDFEMLYLPSAAALPALRAAEATPAQPLGGIAFTPFPTQLSATRGEAAVFRQTMHDGVAVVGRKATEASVREALRAGRIVHVATHGVLNAHNPMFSRIELARNGATGSGDDGRLEIHEVLGLRVRSPLVFLSGCETSAFQVWLDDPVRGTDHTTLAQAFLYAGAGNVAGTLWRIDDAGAAAFAGAFYSLLQQHSPAEALAGAQRRLLADERLASPYYWASYVLSGTGTLNSSAEY